ncbi:MAG: hypothetical protein HY873_07480 [Chloroflexi bacterium]|nr:hypothetical protein [Chloroflexota bacterium]
MFVAFISLFFVIGAVAVDYGLWLSERRGTARAADMAAAAAAQDLPVDPAYAGGSPYETRGDCDNDACDAAFRWAERNGYGDSDTTDVRLYFYCGNTIPVEHADACFNEAQNTAFGLSPCPSAAGETHCDSVNVQVERDAARMFSSFFGGAVDFDVGFSAWGNVSYRIKPLDTVMSIDASGSMGDGCDSPGVCPIEEARIGANQFTDILFGDNPEDGNVQIGYAPYRACYRPPSSAGSCVPSIDPLTPGQCKPAPPSDDSWVVCLTKEPETLKEAIEATDPGSGTNVCLGLYESNEILLGPDAQDSDTPGLQRIIVILTDGENFFQSGSGITVPPECTPSSSCGDAASSGDEVDRLDRCTWELAENIKNNPANCIDPPDPDPEHPPPSCAEIYVIGLNVAPGPKQPNPHCDDIGNDDPDGIAHRRLLKCIASSPAHYKETNSTIELGNIFSNLAYEIADRGLVSGGE